MRINKRTEALNALANIRDYVRDIGRTNQTVKDELFLLGASFNIVARQLGAEGDWMIEKFEEPHCVNCGHSRSDHRNARMTGQPWCYHTDEKGKDCGCIEWETEMEEISHGNT